MTYQFRTGGVCSQAIVLDLGDDGRIRALQFFGGCPGNLQGISRLVVGMTPKEVADRLAGIRCGDKPTSCPDQLAHFLRSLPERQ